jgi:fatty acid desaturase
VNAVMDRVDINRTLFTILTNFGEHGLHHMFPTLDHALLPSLRDVFFETCEEFKTELRMTNQMDMIIGHFRQIARTEMR